MKKYNFPPWYSYKLKHLITQKKIAHSCFKVTNDYVDYQTFSNLRYSVKQESELSYFNYLNQTQQNLITLLIIR